METDGQQATEVDKPTPSCTGSEVCPRGPNSLGFLMRLESLTFQQWLHPHFLWVDCFNWEHWVAVHPILKRYFNLTDLPTSQLREEWRHSSRAVNKAPSWPSLLRCCLWSIACPAPRPLGFPPVLGTSHVLCTSHVWSLLDPCYLKCGLAWPMSLWEMQTLRPHDQPLRRSLPGGSVHITALTTCLGPWLFLSPWLQVLILSPLPPPCPTPA